MRSNVLRFGCLVALLAGLGLLSPAVLAQGTITTFAGNGSQTFGGDGGPATAAMLNRPVYVHAGVDGNIYIADEFNRRIRKVDRNGTITTFAGNGAVGFSGDGGPATAAMLNAPNGLCGDAAGNIYINDTLNQRIRKVDRNGIITTFAGNGSQTTFGDGGPATAAGMWLPIRCDFDPQGRMVIAEQGGHRVRRVDTNGVISTIAGTGAIGFSGDGGPATAAMLNNPTSVAVDAAGNVYFSDQSNHRIRKIDPGGTITTFAGNGTAAYGGDGGPATAASFHFPGGLAVDHQGSVYVAESISFRIRQITPQGLVRTIAGTGARGYSGDGGPATAAAVNEPFGIDLDSSGNIYFADTLNNRVRVISALAPQNAPTFVPSDATNSASFEPGFTPGGLATIFGDNISSANGIVVTSQVPWLESLNGVLVSVNGTPARMYAVVTLNGKEQISFQVPFNVSAGQADVVVRNNGAVSATVQVPVLAAQPGIFILADGSTGAFLHANYALITAANRAQRGETVLAYVTGLGTVNPPVANGAVAPGAEPFARSVANPIVRVGGVQAALGYSGLAPGYIGLYQLNFVVPPNAPVGSVDITVESNGIVSNSARMAIE